MIAWVDRECTHWASWRVEILQRGYFFRSTLADVRDSRGASSGGEVGPSAPRAWGVANGPDLAMLELEAAVRAIEERHRQVVTLVYCGTCSLVRAGSKRQHLSHAEIAEWLGCKRPTVYDRLHSAHQAIELVLKPHLKGLDKAKRCPTESARSR